MFTGRRRLNFAISMVTVLLSRPGRIPAQDLREVAVLDHGQSLVSAIFTPDAKRLVSSDKFGRVKVWELEAEKPKHRWVKTAVADRILSVTSAVLSPDGMSLVTIVNKRKANDQGAFLLELTSGKRLKRFGPPMGVIDFENDGWPFVASFSPDGKTLAMGNTSGNFILWDSATGKEIVRLCENKENDSARNIHAVCFSPDGKRLAAETGVKTGNSVKSRSISIWDVTKKARISSWECHKFPIIAAAFINDGTTLVTGSRDETVRVWDAVTGKEKATIKVGSEVRSMSMNPSGDILAIGSWVADGDNVYLFDVKSGEKLVSKSVHTVVVSSVAFSADGKMLATTGGGGGVVRIWRVLLEKGK